MIIALASSKLTRYSTITMATCEPKRCNAYSDDLRWRMIYQRCALGLTYETIATSLCVDKATVSRTVDLFERTGGVMKKAYDGVNLPRKLTDTVQFIILHLVLERPGILLREIQAEIKYLAGQELAASTICRFLHRQGFSRQKMQLIAFQRDEALRLTYATEVSIYKADMFIFLDETGTDRRNAIRKYAYSLRGKPARSHKLLVRGERVSAIALMSCSGILDCRLVHGAVDGDTFYSFIQGSVLPHLMPFDGNNPHSVVVMDNASIHHVDGIVSMIQEVGALVLFLPPYSPDYNPIEETFSKVKSTIKAHETEMEIGGMEIEDIVLAAFSSITQDDCYNWISNAGVYTMD